jgi:regulator of sirC expression with transglutaminase-like and TPR domain
LHEKSRLLKEYLSATTDFSAAVKNLHQGMVTSPKEEYARLDRAANEERLKCERARLELEEHVAVHGC